MELHEKLKAFGLNKFRNMRSFAEALDMMPQTLNSYVSGRSKPGTDFLIKILQLGCDLNWLLGEDSRSVNDFIKMRTTNDYLTEPIIKYEPNLTIQHINELELKITENIIGDMFPIIHINDIIILDLEVTPKINDLIYCTYDTGGDPYIFIKFLDNDISPDLHKFYSQKGLPFFTVEKRKVISIYKVKSIIYKQRG